MTKFDGEVKRLISRERPVCLSPVTTVDERVSLGLFVLRGTKLVVD